MFRRKFIKAASGTAVAGLVAGCGGNGGGGGGGEGTTPAGGETTAETETAETETAETETAETETAAQGSLGWSETLGKTPQGLTVANTQLKQVDQGDAGARLTGVIKNTGNKSYEELEVQATLFDQSDDVLGAYFDNTEGEEMENLAPGKQWQFSIDFPQADLGKVARYRVDADAEIDDSVFDVGNETETATTTTTSQ